jgi:Acyl-protein synthetase, LuxE
VLPPIPEHIFNTTEDNFEEQALHLFQFQYAHNDLYKRFVDELQVDPQSIRSLQEIPFLPISFFKTHTVKTTAFDAAQIFESSGTTTSINSQHHVKDPNIYRQSFMQAFKLFYGDIKDWCILALLPAYLERSGSSLVVMADELIKQSGHAKSGFYLHNMNDLQNTLQDLEKAKQKTLLLGVTFALLDFAEQNPMPLPHCTIMETGGMKGRRKEMLREDVHAQLCKAFAVEKIHSEYGMTELLSQGYSTGDGIFNCPPWMKIVLREEDDPLQMTQNKRGLINVIDLANIYSCAFIATDDVGKTFVDGSFEVLGRMDNSDVRGCSLLSL